MKYIRAIGPLVLAGMMTFGVYGCEDGKAENTLNVDYDLDGFTVEGLIEEKLVKFTHFEYGGKCTDILRIDEDVVLYDYDCDGGVDHIFARDVCLIGNPDLNPDDLFTTGDCRSKLKYDSDCKCSEEVLEDAAQVLEKYKGLIGHDKHLEAAREYAKSKDPLEILRGLWGVKNET